MRLVSDVYDAIWFDAELVSSFRENAGIGLLDSDIRRRDNGIDQIRKIHFTTEILQASMPVGDHRDPQTVPS
jgi:hypothetical protein